MTTSGTHIQGLHSTQVRHHTQIDLLTCRVCFVKHMMITTQVRHHTLLDLSTCRVCSVKHRMIMRQYFPQLLYDPYPLHACGLGLCLYFSALVCDLLPRRLLYASPKAHCPKSISVKNLTSTAWKTLGLFGAFSIVVGGHHWSLSATFLGNWWDWLWELVSPRIHASQPTLWSVSLNSRGSDWVCHKLGNDPVLRSGTGSWVLSG